MSPQEWFWVTTGLGLLVLIAALYGMYRGGQQSDEEWRWDRW